MVKSKNWKARALFKIQELLILDEPTSSLDNATESLVIDGIKKLKREKTIILISHRVNTLKIVIKYMK